MHSSAVPRSVTSTSVDECIEVSSDDSSVEEQHDFPPKRQRNSSSTPVQSTTSIGTNKTKTLPKESNHFVVVQASSMSSDFAENRRGHAENV